MGKGYWQFKGDKDWEDYTSKDAKALEDSFNDDDTTLKHKMGGRDYKFNFNAMTQTNKSSGTVRKVRRLVQKKKAQWSFKDDDGYTKFKDDDNFFLCAAYDSKVKLVKRVIQGTEYSFDFNKMTQMNQSTQKVRKLKRAEKGGGSSGTTYNVWEWKGDSGWVPYSALHCVAIEKAHQNDDVKTKIKVNTASGKAIYTIHFGLMQQINSEGGQKRDIRRTKKTKPKSRAVDSDSDSDSDAPAKKKRKKYASSSD